jgi:hypothetical protein
MTRFPRAFEAANYSPFVFAEEQRKHLCNELATRNIEASLYTAFISQLEHDISMYKAAIVSDLSTDSGAARHAIKSALKAVIKLDQQLLKLETAVGRAALRDGDLDLDSIRNGIMVELHTGLPRALAAIPPASSRSVDFSQMFLIKNVGEAIEAHLNVRPTSTRGGLYEAMIEHVYNAATGSPTHSAKALAEKGVNLLKENQPQ